MSTHPVTIVTSASRGFGELTSETLARGALESFGLAHLAQIPAAEVAP